MKKKSTFYSFFIFLDTRKYSFSFDTFSSHRLSWRKWIFHSGFISVLLNRVLFSIFLTQPVFWKKKKLDVLLIVQFFLGQTFASWQILKKICFINYFFLSCVNTASVSRYFYTTHTSKKLCFIHCSLQTRYFFNTIWDTHTSFYSGFSICPHPPTRVAPATRPLAWLRRASESQPSSPEAELNSTDFFNIPQILRALPVLNVTRTL